MSALGDYVHLNTMHYLKKQMYQQIENWKNFNISESDYNNVDPSLFLQNRSKNINNISKSDIEELNRRLGGENYEAAARDEILIRSDRQNLIDEVYKKLQEVSSIEKLEAFQRGNKKVLKSSNLNNDSQLTQTDLEDKVENLRKLKRQLDQAIKWKKQIVDKDTFNDLLKNARALDVPIKGVRYSKDRKKMQSKLGEIKKAAQTIQFNTASHHISGAFGEELFYQLAKTSEDVAQNAIYEEFEKVVGDERSNILIDKKLIAVDLSESKVLSTDELGNSYSLGSTKDKVDVQVIVGENTKVLASIKTVSSIYAKNPYGDIGDIHLQDVGLLPTLTYLNTYGSGIGVSSDFGTHWLNMHTALGTKNQDNADQILQQEISYEALASGNPFKQNSSHANVFVYFDRKSGRFKVERTLDILTNINNNKIIQKFDITKINLINENQKSTSSVDRIKRILTKIRQIQIQVMYNVFK